MAQEIKKPAKPEEPDLLPAMGLFTILIPMLLSMAAFSKLAIVQVNLPERSMINPNDEAVSSRTSTSRKCGRSAASPMPSLLLMPLKMSRL